MKRKIFDDLKKHIEKKQYTILVGARQTGKTTLLRQLYEDQNSEGKRTVFINLEQKDVLSSLNESPLNLLRYLPESGERIIVFIDEVQYLENPSNFLKLIYDEYADKIKIIATGSSAFYIDKKSNDSLAGRKRVFYLGTCSFEEYLELSGKNDLLDEYLRILNNPEAKTTRISELDAALDNYIIYGGYPAVVIENDNDEKIQLLKELRDSYLQRDVEEAGVSNPDAFYKLYVMLAAQTGSQLNVSELATSLRISEQTVNNYLNVLKKCYHIALIKPFYRNVKKELVKMPKVYIMDTGMRNCLINYFPVQLGIADDGALFENYVFHRLREKYDENEIKYWRTADQKEVDFVVEAPRIKAAYEVKFNQGVVKPGKYRVFTENYPEYEFNFVSRVPFSEDRLREFSLAMNCIK